MLAGIMLFFASNAAAGNNVVVVPLGGSAEGNATAADVIEGKTFSSKAAGKGVRGTLKVADKGIVSIHFSAFTPADDGYTFKTDPADTPYGKYLAAQTPNLQFWMAPVYLPDGATVTKFTFYWANTSSSVAGSATLYRTDFKGNEDKMAQITAVVDTPDPTSSHEDTINYATVDNTNYDYYIWLRLRQENGEVRAYGATVEYNLQ